MPPGMLAETEREAQGRPRARTVSKAHTPVAARLEICAVSEPQLSSAGAHRRASKNPGLQSQLAVGWTRSPLTHQCRVLWLPGGARDLVHKRDRLHPTWSLATAFGREQQSLWLARSVEATTIPWCLYALNVAGNNSAIFSPCSLSTWENN